MKAKKEYVIPFVGLKQGIHQFEYESLGMSLTMKTRNY